MNQVNNFNAGAVASMPKPASVKSIENVPLRMATCTGLFSNPLGAGPHAFGKLASAWSVRCGSLHSCIPPRQHCHEGHHHGPSIFHPHRHHDHHHNGHHHHHGPSIFHPHRHDHHHHHHHVQPPRCGTPEPKPGCWTLPEPKVSWTAKMTGENTAKIDLGDGYKLDINEKNSEMMIINEKTGEKTKIWGDPHVDVDGKRAFDFWGTTTFTLENGTKLTINTEQYKGNPNMYVASQVLITKGDNAIVVDGISQNKLGDLSVSMSNNGQEIDAANRDGWTLHENANGSGWRTENGNIATQKDADVTRIGAEFGPGSTALSQAEAAEQGLDFDFSQMVNQISSYLLFGAVVSGLIDMFGGNSGNSFARGDDNVGKQRDPIPFRRFDSVLP